MKPEVEEVAQLMWEGNTAAATERAESEFGWEFLGGGAGRRAFLVTQEHQEGPVENATEGAPCVVKFATPGHHYDGRTQNQDEVTQFQRFPSELTEPESDDPLFVPVKDWDEDRFLWLSMPLADGDKGQPYEVKHRLAHNGWKCADIKRDNVGELHGQGVILDYGLDCETRPTPTEMLDEVQSELDRLGCFDFRQEQEEDIYGSPVYRLYFSTPAGLLDLPPTTKESSVLIDKNDVNSFDFYFGAYPEDRAELVIEAFTEVENTNIPSLDFAAEQVVDGFHDDWFKLEPPQYKLEADGRGYFHVNISTTAPRGLPPDVVYDVASDLFEKVEERFPGGEQYPALDEEINERLNFEAEVGMVLDHPEFVEPVTVVETGPGKTVVMDSSGYDYNLQRDDHPYEQPTPEMVEGYTDVEEEINDAIDSAIEDALPTTDDD